jgi:hypothetical protein
MNNRNIAFSNKLESVAEEGRDFVKNFRDASNFEYQLEVHTNLDIELRHYQH